MKRKLPLVLALTFATMFMIACGDELTAQEKEEIICGKMVLRYGATSCTPGGGTSSTNTTTTTTTVTVTSTS